MLSARHHVTQGVGKKPPGPPKGTDRGPAMIVQSAIKQAGTVTTAAIARPLRACSLTGCRDQGVLGDRRLCCLCGCRAVSNCLRGLCTQRRCRRVLGSCRGRCRAVRAGVYRGQQNGFAAAGSRRQDPSFGDRWPPCSGWSGVPPPGRQIIPTGDQGQDGGNPKHRLADQRHRQEAQVQDRRG